MAETTLDSPLTQEIGPSEAQLARAATTYSNYQNEHNRALRVGIFGEDLLRAQRNPETTFVNIVEEAGEVLPVPALVPIADLEWFNKDLLKRTYGEAADVRVYVHPPTSDVVTTGEISNVLSKTLDEGKIVLTEVYVDDTTSPIARFIAQARQDMDIKIEAFGATEESRVDFFVGTVDFHGEHKVGKTTSIYELYSEAIEQGELNGDDQNGPSLVAVIEGEEAEQIWGIYEKPFEGLGKDDPTLAGFDKESLLEILKDPNTAKIVNRVDGKITTLMLFLQDLEKTPWFNKTTYQKDYAQYFETNNILIFPGIVTDESLRGNNYATDVVDFAANLMARRGSSLIITFECTEVSSAYIPKLVDAAISNSGVARVTGLDQPIGSIEYYALQKL